MSMEVIENKNHLLVVSIGVFLLIDKSNENESKATIKLKTIKK